MQVAGTLPSATDEISEFAQAVSFSETAFSECAVWEHLEYTPRLGFQAQTAGVAGVTGAAKVTIAAEEGALGTAFTSVTWVTGVAGATITAEDATLRVGFILCLAAWAG